MKKVVLILLMVKMDKQLKENESELEENKREISEAEDV